MTRLPPINLNEATDQQRSLWDRLVETRGGGGLQLTDASGSPVGPFGAMIHRPDIGAPLADVGNAVRYGNALEPRVMELAIATVGAHWKSEFEWFAHRRLAARAGIGAAALDALAAGVPPVFEADDEKIIHRYAAELCERGRVAQATYDAVADTFGVDGVIDLTMTVGYYTHICMILNAFEVALPLGVDAAWENL